MFGLCQHDCFAHIALCKCCTDISLVIRYFQLLHQVFADQLIADIAQLQHDTSGSDGRKKLLCILSQKKNHRILRWLFQCLQQCILRLRRHQICLRHNINLIWSLIRLDLNIVIQLCTNVIHTDRIRLLMLHPDYIRMIATICLFAGMTLVTRRTSLFLTKQRLCKKRCQHLLTRTTFSV